MPADDDFADRTEQHRHELRVHCYRMLASYEDAEDAEDETVLRAWRRRGDLERDEHLRAWLYKIATNICLDTIRAKKRRLMTYDSFRDVPWLEPFPDRLLDAPAPATAQPDAALRPRVDRADLPRRRPTAAAAPAGRADPAPSARLAGR